ncbi:MAG: crossover junction endodeoxyribonuclease RuvC [bacterium]
MKGSAQPAAKFSARRIVPDKGWKPGRILGLDPGLSATGFGVLNEAGWVLKYGVISTDSGQGVSERLLHLSQEVRKIVKKFQPKYCAVETLFFKGGGARSVILSAQSRGTILTVLAKDRVPVFELTPATVKLAATGSGRASKSQLNYMIRKLLKINHDLPEHAADALAVAYCLRSRLAR